MLNKKLPPPQKKIKNNKIENHKNTKSNKIFKNPKQKHSKTIKTIRKINNKIKNKNKTAI